MPGTLLLETIRASDCGRPNQRSPKIGSTVPRYLKLSQSSTFELSIERGTYEKYYSV